MSVVAGTVYLVGAGPGDPGLITVRGLELLRKADVVVHDRLIGHELLRHARKAAEIVDVGKTPESDSSAAQGRINDLLVDRARRGLRVVRLKGGDPFVFGRGYEEMSFCIAAGVPCEMVPGVSSALAAPAAAGIPITSRKLVRSFAVVSGSTARDSEAPRLDYSALARLDACVLLMGRERLGEIARDFMRAGRDPATPVACIERATTPQQRVVKGTLADIAEIADQAAIHSPMVAVIGSVAALAVVNGPKGARQEAGSRPLAGMRVVVTRPQRQARAIRVALENAGAHVISCPLVEIVFPCVGEDPSRSVENLSAYDVLAFTSANAVDGFRRRCSVLGVALDALRDCRVAAVGAATAAAARRIGLTPEIVPATHNAAALAQEIRAAFGTSAARVLFPCGDRALPTLPNALRAAGMVVDTLQVYRSVSVTPPASALEAVRQGTDVALCYSPSAVAALRALGLVKSCRAVLCVGQTTVDAAGGQGGTPFVIPTGRAATVVRALEDWARRNPA